MTADLLLSDENVRKLALTLLHFLWQGALLGALAWGMLHVLAPRSAQARYAIHCGLLLLLMAAPIATFLALSTGGGPVQAVNYQPPKQEAASHTTIDEPTPAVDAGDSIQQGYATVLRAWFERAQSWLVACWFIGSTILGIRLTLGAVGIWRILRTRQPLPPEVDAMVDRLIQSMAFRIRPAVYASEQVSQAIAIGVIWPMVLLPAAWVLELQPEVLEAVLAHELAHLRRWDLPVNLLQRLVETLLFFHPVVWWCSRRLRIERELCCDERATLATGDRAGYAEALTFLAERQVSTWEPLLAAGIGGSRMVLLERIRNVLGVSRRAHGRFYGLSCAVVGAAAASLAWLAILYAQRDKVEVAAAAIQSPPAATARRAPWPMGAQASVGADGKALPSEYKMATLPEYVIEPPDVLFIEAIRVVPKGPHRIQNADVVSVQLTGGFPTAPAGTGTKGDQFLVGSTGRIDLGVAYGEAGRVQVTGMTEDEAARAIEASLRAVVKEPQVSVQVAQTAAMQPITGEHLVAPDGTVNLGTYGRVNLAGMTLDEGRAAIEQHLDATLDKPQVFLSVFGYNSKVYYVVTEGKSLGDTVARFPITGNETVLDALAEMNGLKQLQSKHIWIARPYAGGTGCDAILPVSWKEITTGAATASNYQVLPGDRIFISDSPPAVPLRPQSNASDAAAAS